MGPLLELAGRFPLKVLAMPDHATPLSLKTHSDDPVPFAAWDSRIRGEGSGRPFSEPEAAATGVEFARGHELMQGFLSWSWPGRR